MAEKAEQVSVKKAAMDAQDVRACGAHRAFRALGVELTTYRFTTLGRRNRRPAALRSSVTLTAASRWDEKA
jgi:hypothetical protein